MPVSIRLPADIEQRLASLANATGRSKTFYIREAILEHLDDIEDAYLAERRLEDVRSGRSRTISLEQVEQELDLAD